MTGLAAAVGALTNCPLALSRLRMHVLHSKTAAGPKTCRHDTECSDWKHLRQKMKHCYKTIYVQTYEQNRTSASREHQHLRFHKELPYSAQAWCILTLYRCFDPMLQNQKRGTAPMLKDPVLGKRLGLTSMGSSFCSPWAAARIELSIGIGKSSPCARCARSHALEQCAAPSVAFS